MSGETRAAWVASSALEEAVDASVALRRSEAVKQRSALRSNRNDCLHWEGFANREVRDFHSGAFFGV